MTHGNGYRFNAVIPNKRPVLTVMLFFAMLSFCASCGGGKEESKTPAAGESRATDLSWNDVPIYPKATALQRDDKMINAMIEKSHTEKGEVRFWTTNAPSNSVITYYETELPKLGWEKIMGMKMGASSYVMTWNKKVKGEDKGISVTVSDSRGEGKVRISIIMGQG